MDKASDFESEDCGFESHLGQDFSCVAFVFALYGLISKTLKTCINNLPTPTYT